MFQLGFANSGKGLHTYVTTRKSCLGILHCLDFDRIPFLKPSSKQPGAEEWRGRWLGVRGLASDVHQPRQLREALRPQIGWAIVVWIVRVGWSSCEHVDCSPDMILLALPQLNSRPGILELLLHLLDSELVVRKRYQFLKNMHEKAGNRNTLKCFWARRKAGFRQKKQV